MTERTLVRRLRELLRREQLLFVRVGAYASDTRVVSTHTELPSGATVNAREYTAILRAIVREISR